MAANNVDNFEDSEGTHNTTLFAVRTTIGQEKGVLQLLFNRLRVMNPFPDVKVMMISEQLRGYVFVEATHQRDVLLLISGVPHIKGKVVGSIKLSSIAHVISPRRVTEVLEEGDEVEIISGIFQNQKAQVIRMPKEGAKEEVTLRLLDSDSAISIKIHGDFLKLVRKGEKHKDRYIMKESEIVDGEGAENAKPVEVEEPAAAGTEGTSTPHTVKSSKKDIPVPIIQENAESAKPVYTFDEDKEKEEFPDIIEDISKEIRPTKPEKREKKKEEDTEDDDEWSKFSF